MMERIASTSKMEIKRPAIWNRKNPSIHARKRRMPIAINMMSFTRNIDFYCRNTECFPAILVLGSVRVPDCCFAGWKIR